MKEEKMIVIRDTDNGETLGFLRTSEETECIQTEILHLREKWANESDQYFMEFLRTELGKDWDVSWIDSKEISIIEV